MAVLADWLLDRGDPRGELIQLQLALEASPGVPRLAAAQDRHLALHAKHFLGPLALQQSVVTLTWRRGYVVAAAARSLTSLDWEWGPRRGDVEPVNRLGRAMRQLGRLPEAGHLRELRLEQPWSRVVRQHLAEALDAVRASRLTLRRLSIATPDPYTDQRDPPVHVHLGELEVDCSPGLERLVRRALG